jgi:phage terminase large subunit-like protein
LWTRAELDEHRVYQVGDLARVVVGVDPSGSSGGDAVGIVVAGLRFDEMYIVSDATLQASPNDWAKAAVAEYYKFKADVMVAEKNYGGEMVEAVIHGVDPMVNVKLVTATRGKAVRAEPISAFYERGRCHHVGNYPALEDELCLWVQGDNSPNRLDALVWAGTELLLGGGAVWADVEPLGKVDEFISPWQ